MSLKKNFIYQTAYQILTVITPLITAPYIARVLGAENIGISAYTYSIVGYFINFATLGISNYANRSLSILRDDKEKLSTTFCAIFLMHLIVCILSVLIFLVYCIFFEQNYIMIFLIQGIHLLSCFFDISWLYFGLEEFKLITIRNIILKLLSVVCMFIFVRSDNDLVSYCLILAISTLLSQIILWFKVNKYIEFKKVKMKDALIHLKPMLILFLPVISVFIYKYMDKTMLGQISTMQEVGYYENSEKIINICLGVITALGTVMLPRMALLYNKKEEKKINYYLRYGFMISSFLSCGMSFGLLLIAKEFIPFFFGEDYVSCIPLTSVLAFSLIFSAFSSMIKSAYLLPNKRDKSFTVTLFIGAIVNFVINLILIPKYGALGATIATLITEFIVALTQSIIVFTNINILQYLKDILPFIISGIGMYIIINVIPIHFQSELLNIIWKIILGGITYTIIALVYFVVFDRDTIEEVCQILRLKDKLKRS